VVLAVLVEAAQEAQPLLVWQEQRTQAVAVAVVVVLVLLLTAVTVGLVLLSFAR
jgi:hypothetical protein